MPRPSRTTAPMTLRSTPAPPSRHWRGRPRVRPHVRPVLDHAPAPRPAAVAVVGAGLVGIGLPSPRRRPSRSFQARHPRRDAVVRRHRRARRPAVVSIPTTNEVKVADRSRGPGAPGALVRPRCWSWWVSVQGIPGLPDDDLLNEFFKNMPDGPGGGGNPMSSGRVEAAGSGFVVSSDGGIVTNDHVVDGATKVKVSFDDEARDRRQDRRHRVAYLISVLRDRARAAADGLKFAEKTPRVGDWVLAVGIGSASAARSRPVSFGARP